MIDVATKTLLEVCEFIVDCEHKTAPTSTSGYPSIRTPNIGRGRLILDGVNYVSEEVYREWTRRAEPQAGDLILAREAPVGNVAIVPPGLKVCLGQRTVLIRPNREEVDPNYLMYRLLSDKIQGQLLSLSNGATVHHLNVADIKRLPLPKLPSPTTQRKIAAVLSAYDDLIENNTHRIAILESMAQMLYREWFVHFRFPGHATYKMIDSSLGPIPEEWDVLPFTSIADILSGGTPRTSTPEYWDGEIPFFCPKDASSSFYVISTEKTITEQGLRACNSRLYPKHTVFVTARGTVGKVVLPARAMAMNQSCYAISGKGGLDQLFLFFVTRQCAEQLKKNATGAVFDAIVVDTFKAINVARPPVALTAQFGEIIRPIFDLMLALTQKNSNLHRTRDLLLPKLISGEVDVERLDIDRGELSG